MITLIRSINFIELEWFYELLKDNVAHISGSLLSLSFNSKREHKESRCKYVIRVFVNFFGAIALSVYLTPITLKYLKIDAMNMDTASFLTALLGMFIVNKFYKGEIPFLNKSKK